MPSKRKNDKSKEQDRCKWCNEKIVLHPGTTQTWIHVDTGKSERPSPMLHNAMPRSRKQS